MVFVRQKHLANIVSCSHECVPRFVVQLLGEYVIEIICVMEENLKNLDASLCSQFLLSNPSFFDSDPTTGSKLWGLLLPLYWQR